MWPNLGSGPKAETQGDRERETDVLSWCFLFLHLLSDLLMSSDTAGVTVSPSAVTVATEDNAPGWGCHCLPVLLPLCSLSPWLEQTKRDLSVFFFFFTLWSLCYTCTPCVCARRRYKTHLRRTDRKFRQELNFFIPVSRRSVQLETCSICGFCLRQRRLTWENQCKK